MQPPSQPGSISERPRSLASAQPISDRLRRRYSRTRFSVNIWFWHEAGSLLCVALFLLTALVGVWVAYDRQLALGRFGLLAFGAIGMLLISWAGVRSVSATLGLIGLACALGTTLLSIISIFTNWLYSGTAAGVLLLLLPLSANGVRWLWQRERRLAYLTSGGILFGLVALWFTGERSAWLSLIAGLIVALFTDSVTNLTKRRKVRWLIYGSFALVTVGLLATFAWFILEPASDLWLRAIGLDVLLAERLPLWRDTLPLILDYRFTGSGLGDTALVYSSYIFFLHLPYFTHAHNLYLQVAVEHGIPGFIIFVGLVTGAVWSLLAARGHAQSRYRWYFAATTTAVTALFVNGLLDSEVYASAFVPLFFVPLGCALALRWSTAGTKSIVPGKALRAWPLLLSWFILTSVALVATNNQADILANIGAVLQGHTELTAYVPQESSFLDEFRRTKAVDLRNTMQYYLEAYKLDDHNATAQRRLGQVALSMGEYAQAEGYLTGAHAAAPNEQVTERLLGELYAITGRVEEAAILWQQGAIQAQQFADRRWWHEHVGETQAIKWLDQAMALVKK